MGAKARLTPFQGRRRLLLGTAPPFPLVTGIKCQHNEYRDWMTLRRYTPTDRYVATVILKVQRKCRMLVSTVSLSSHQLRWILRISTQLFSHQLKWILRTLPRQNLSSLKLQLQQILVFRADYNEFTIYFIKFMISLISKNVCLWH